MESSLEDKNWKSLHQECNCNEDFSCASQKQEISTSHHNSSEHYVSISSGRDVNEEEHRLSTAAVMSNDAVISVPESLIVKLLRASGAATDYMFRDTLADKSNYITENKLQQNSRTDTINYVLVIFVNYGTELRSSEERTMHDCIYSGTFTWSALVKDEVVFVPYVEVGLAFLLDFFRHLPKPFSCVVEDLGLHKIFCIKDQGHSSRLLGRDLKSSDKTGKDLEKSNSVFIGGSTIILQVPGVLLPCCLELATGGSGSSQNCITTRSFILSDKEKLVSLRDSLSEEEVSDNCIAGKAVVTNEFKTSSNINCIRLGSSSEIFQDLNLCSKEKYSGETKGQECTVTQGAPKASGELKQVTGEVTKENLDGIFTCEHHNELPLYEGDQGSLQWSAGQKLESVDTNVCKCASRSSLDLDWSEDAGQGYSDGAASSCATHETMAHRILLELRSLSHSLLDVFDIIQRTPPLTKRTFLLPQELLCQHKILHASTSSLESCPLAQSECFRLNEGGASNTKKRKKKKKGVM